MSTAKWNYSEKSIAILLLLLFAIRNQLYSITIASGKSFHFTKTIKMARVCWVFAIYQFSCGNKRAECCFWTYLFIVCERPIKLYLLEQKLEFRNHNKWMEIKIVKVVTIFFSGVSCAFPFQWIVEPKNI